MMRQGGRREPLDLWERLTRITCPTLLVRGAESDVLSPELAERVVAALPDGRIVEVPEAGHTVPGDRPREFVEVVRGFLSPGGGLTVATLLALRDAGLPLAAAGVCISPWVDLTCSEASYATKADADPIVKRAGVDEMARAYLGAADRRTPLASPLFANLRGLPPLLIQVGSEEVLLDDSVQLAERARAAGVDTTLEVWDQMIHVWHWFLPMLDEAEQAVAAIGRFAVARMTG
jgi:acetyl esterase/lipase